MADSSTMRTRSAQNKRSRARQEARQPAKKSRSDTPTRRHRSLPPERSPERNVDTSDKSGISCDSSSSACTSDTSDFSDDSLDDEKTDLPGCTVMAEWGELAARWSPPLRPRRYMYDPCPWHRTRRIDVFCNMHNVVCCELCRHTRHKDCCTVTSMHSIPGGTSTEHEQALEQVRFELLEHLPAVDKLRKRQARNVELLENRGKEYDDRTAPPTRKQTSKLQELDMELSKAKLDLENINNAKAAIAVWIDKLGESCRDGFHVFSRICQGKELANDVKELLTRPQIDKLYTIKQKTKLNLRIGEDTRRCQIWGICQLADGGFVVSDSSNKRLKQLNSEDNIVGHCTVPRSPRDVCCTGIGEVAVNLYQSCIQFVSVGDHGMVCTRSFSVAKHTCYSMAFHDNCLYMTAEQRGNKCIYVYTLYGELLRKIGKPQHGYSRVLSYPLHIAISTLHNRIYVADRDKGLVTLGMDGQREAKLRFRDESSNGWGVEGVCVDRSGNVFVKGLDVNTIVQVSKGGDRKVGIVMPDSMWDADGGIEAWQIHFDNVNNRLLVCGCNYYDTLIVLELSQ